jgi:hypothetical protein
MQKKYWIVLFLSLFSFNLLAESSWVRVEFIGPCSSKAFLSQSMKVPKTTDLLSLSKSVLLGAGVSFLDDGRGFAQVASSPMGDQALVVFGKNNEKMRAYGWCFSVNNQIPMNFASKLQVGSEPLVLRWFYAYSEIHKDKWLNMCVPSYLVKDKQICPSEN